MLVVRKGDGERETRPKVALSGTRTEHAENHGDLAGMVDGVLDDSWEQLFVGVSAAGNLFGQFLDGKIAKVLFEQVAATVPAGDEFVPGNRRLGPFLLGLPGRERMAVRGFLNSFIPEEQMLKQGGNRMSTRNRRRDSEFGRDLCQQFGKRRSIPGAFDGYGAVRVGDLLGLLHLCLAETRRGWRRVRRVSLHQARLAVASASCAVAKLSVEVTRAKNNSVGGRRGTAGARVLARESASIGAACAPSRNCLPWGRGRSRVVPREECCPQ
jgi:hypothetical protein